MKESVKIVKLAWLARLYISKLMVMVLVVHVKFFCLLILFSPNRDFVSIKDVVKEHVEGQALLIATVLNTTSRNHK